MTRLHALWRVLTGGSVMFRVKVAGEFKVKNYLARDGGDLLITQCHIEHLDTSDAGFPIRFDDYTWNQVTQKMDSFRE